VIFDVCDNKYRLIAALKFEGGELLMEAVLTHKEYDRETF
jgi:mRNA-degrading endonuclease HigB of HigAB toxin-antitoxin module